MAIRREYLSAMSMIRRRGWVSREEIRAYQNRQLQRLVLHAYHHVPYYRALFERHKIVPDDIQTTADLRIVPITDKQDLQRLPVTDLIASGIRPDRLLSAQTSGVTGEPLTIHRNRLEQTLTYSIFNRALRYYGLKSSFTIANLHLAAGPLLKPLAWRILNRFGLHRVKMINVLDPPKKIIDKLLEIKPDVIISYAGILARIASEIDSEKRKKIRPAFVVTGAEVLSPDMRERIQKAFNAVAYDTYGCEELNLMAWECKETGTYHVCDDDLILEILKDGSEVKEGEQGEVVGTSLHAFTMPFIRYRVRDTITKGEETCPCGQPYSVVSGIQGRMHDFFRLPGGRILDPYNISLSFVFDTPWLRQYELVQGTEDSVVLRMVPAGTPPDPEVKAIESQIRNILGPEVTFAVELVDEIRPGPGGKFRCRRSLVGSEYD